MTGELQTVHELFEERALRAPQAVAVVCGDQRLSYGELDARANRLAHHLIGLGLGPGRIAAVALGRGPELLTALLAVLKTGAAYVPLEPTGPDRVIRHVLVDADPLVVVTEEVYRVRLADAAEADLLCVDTAAPAFAELPAGRPAVTLSGTEPACVFYTSGSTGLPKGAVVEHRNLLHSFRGWQQVYHLTPADRVLQTATLEFDVFTADWIRALGSGAVLVLARRNFTLDRTADVAELHALVVDGQITVMETNLHTARRLFDHLRPRGLELGQLRLLTVGAEKWYLDEQLRLQGYLGPAVRVLNVYGVAEASVDSTYFDTAALADPPEHPETVSLIGTPFPGNRVHLLDPQGRPVADGEVGEICLGGPGVGRGYLNRPKLTSARFVTTEHDPDGRIYRTGDLARRRPDGLLEYLGRDTDRTGARSAGVEAALRGHPAVKESAVAELDHRLVAYVVTGPEEGAEAPADPWALRAYLAERLPADAVPDAVVPLPALPRTRAGKLDRRHLPLPAPRPPAEGGGKAARPRGVKGGGSAGRPDGAGRQRPLAHLLLTLFLGGLAYALTPDLWPGSTDTSAVPGPWAGVFEALYVCEAAGFGLGAAFLLLGGAAVRLQGRPAWLARATHLAVCWLLASWWPQDNLYRTTAATDWPAQAALVLGFNLTLLLAAALVARFVTWRPQGLSE
ncbi:amino acid adenylation domain-containing protein [Kitasatospora camelliae]|uniref:Amino acid adenylation domain-containing protein n=1 Tax=Kitasatospora camelliae TaxID=3156397 RepID=A0AAU8K3T1_9ACTN